MPEVYSNAQEVIRFTGIRPDDLGLKDEEDKTKDVLLAEIVTGWLVEAKNLIDEDRNRDYHQEVAQGKRTEIPPGINNIAKRMVANMVGQAVLRRETPIVRVDDFEMKMVDEQIFTNSIKSDLARYPYKRAFKLFAVGGQKEE